MAPRQFIGAIFFTLTVVGYSQGHQDGTVNCEFSTNCNTDENTKAVINCDKNIMTPDATDVCKCNGDFCDKIVVENSKFNEVTVPTCENWCTTAKDTENEENNCKFWKFTHTAFNTKCFLMDKTGCQTEASEVCDHKPDHGDANFPHCQSGYLEGAPLCTEDSTPPPPPPPPAPCPGPIIAGDPDDTTKFYQKWICLWTDDEGATDEMDMYKSDSNMPVGGFCKLDDADGSCRKLNIQYRYTCGTTGKWEKSSGVEEGDEDGYDSNKNQLMDLQCAAADLPNVPDEDGRELHCINEGMTANTIPAENSCLMTCDGYSVLSAFTDWKTEGEGRGWFYKISGSDAAPAALTNGAFLKCWDRR